MKISQPGHRGRSAAALTLLLALTTFGVASLAQQDGGVPLNPSHPDRYVVKRGDTLWDISAMFLRDPWYWPEIWYVNPQVENPHLIYPGDILTLVYVDGRPQIRLERGAGTEKLSPRIRETALADAITTIPYDVIAPFLTRGSVLEKDEIRSLPYIVALRDGHLMGASGNDVYARGEIGEPATTYNIVHVGDRLVDPDDGDVVGYQGLFVAKGLVRRAGDPATLVLNESAREALEGDRLIRNDYAPPLQFLPRPPDSPVSGRIIHVIDGVTQIGQYHVVVLNRGASHGLEPGHVLHVWQAGRKVPDRVKSGFLGGKVPLPEERAGTVMVFRTYDRISYGLVMQAEAPIHTLDTVRNPG